LIPRHSHFINRIVKAGYIYLFAQTDSGPYAGRFFADTSASLMRVGFGFSLAVVTGIPLGLLSGRVAICRRLMSATVNGVRAVPGICWLLWPWYGSALACAPRFSW
jgi:sulfonate transport system permease protein